MSANRLKRTRLLVDYQESSRYSVGSSCRMLLRAFDLDCEPRTRRHCLRLFVTRRRRQGAQVTASYFSNSMPKCWMSGLLYTAHATSYLMSLPYLSYSYCHHYILPIMAISQYVMVGTLARNITDALVHPFKSCFSVALLLGSVAVQSIIGQQPLSSARQGLDAFIDAQASISYNGLLCNIGPDGCHARGAAPGVVVASPNRQDPDCE